MPWNKNNRPPQLKTDAEVRQAEAIRKKCVEDDGDEKECAAKAIRIVLSRRKGGAMAEEQSTEVAEQFVEETRLQRMVQNFTDNVYGIDVSVDVNHDFHSGAAAWIQGLEVRPSSSDPLKQSLWADVKWTEFGKEIAGPEKKYKYISAEFGPYTNPETKESFKDVLQAATLTIRPFMKGMQPVKASEDEESIEILREGEFFDPYRWGSETKSIKASEQKRLAQRIQEAVTGFFAERTPQGKTTQEGDTTVDESKIREILAAHDVELTDEMSKDDLLAKLKETLEARDGRITELEAAANQEPFAPPSEEQVQLTERNTQLAEQNRQLETEKTQLAERVTAIETELTETKKNAFFESVIRDGKLKPADREQFAKLYDADSETVCAMLEGREVESEAKLTEQGSSSAKETGDREDKVIQFAEQLVKDEGIRLDEALVRVTREHPELVGDE